MLPISTVAKNPGQFLEICANDRCSVAAGSALELKINQVARTVTALQTALKKASITVRSNATDPVPPLQARAQQAVTPMTFDLLTKAASLDVHLPQTTYSGNATASDVVDGHVLLPARLNIPTTPWEVDWRHCKRISVKRTDTCNSAGIPQRPRSATAFLSKKARI